MINNPEQFKIPKVSRPELWNNIRDFQFDSPSDVFGFSLRLAQEQMWTKLFTKQAIEEYKKFMYLAAISESMVSPSPVVDEVWHLHLVYTKSYEDFCQILGKKVQHIPALHNEGEGNRFLDAKLHTEELYKSEFGLMPADHWKFKTNTDGMKLEKAKYKLRSVLIVILLILGIILLPLFYAVLPIYATIPSSSFITLFLLISFLSYVMLTWYNAVNLSELWETIRPNSTLKNLNADEVLYLSTGRIESVINARTDLMIKRGVLAVENRKVKVSLEQELNESEEVQIFDIVRSMDKEKYTKMLRKLCERPVFRNTVISMNEIQKYLKKSKRLNKLIYLNLAVLIPLNAAGLLRIATGVYRDKPILIISILMIISILVVAFHVFRLQKQLFRSTIPKWFTRKLRNTIPDSAEDLWPYVFIGNAAMTPLFYEIADTSFQERINKEGSNLTGDGGSSGCGSSCGSSCGGGSCGGCGGGGD